MQNSKNLFNQLHSIIPQGINKPKPTKTKTIKRNPADQSTESTTMSTSKDPPSFLTATKSSRSEATALERSRRTAEIEQIRQLKAQSGSSDFNAMRRQLAEKAQNGAPIHNLEDWRAEQQAKAEEDRRKKLEANENLHGYRNKELDSRIPKKERKFRTKQFQGVIGDVEYPEFGGQEGQCDEEGEEEYEEERQVGKLRWSVNDGQATEEEVKIKMNEMEIGNDDSQHTKSRENEPFEEEIANDNGAPPEEEPEIEPEPGPESEPSFPEEETSAQLEPTPSLPEPKTYTRTDVKFSFGLIVRSNSSNKLVSENLRENETLKKCMSATAKILVQKMASPPPLELLEGDGDGSYLPEAYYDPDVTPVVISIEEQEKGDKPLEKNTKRTLVKASFPVYLRDGNLDEAGREKSSRVLKETKSTVFKALREAVSGGSFLR